MQKKLIYISLLISLLSLTFACQTETFEFEQDSNSVIELADGRLRVPIHLHIPEREVVETKSAPSDSEKAVKTVDVCVFDASGNILEKDSGVIDPNNSLRVFAKVLPRNVACKVQVYVNIPAECRARFYAAETKTLAAVQALTMSNAIFEKDYINISGLPIVSELKEYTELNKTTLENQIAKLKFAYTRIDITVSLEAGFTLSSCQGLNFRQNSYLTEQTPLASPDGVFQSPETTPPTGIYLFESPGSTPTDLLIKGTKTGIGEVGYYKIRIAYEDINKVATYDIRRGVRYAVNITSVKGPGYLTKEEAIANEPSNVEFDITVDDGSSKDVVISNGKYYLGVSNSEFVVYDNKEPYSYNITTLTHNAPDNITKTLNATTGITLESQIGQPNVSTDIKCRLDNNFSSGSINIRIGDIIKNISIIRREMASNNSIISDFATSIINVAEYMGNNRMPSWIKVGASNNNFNSNKNTYSTGQGVFFQISTNNSSDTRCEFSLSRNNSEGTIKTHFYRIKTNNTGLVYLNSSGELAVGNWGTEVNIDNILLFRLGGLVGISAHEKWDNSGNRIILYNPTSITFNSLDDLINKVPNYNNNDGWDNGMRNISDTRFHNNTNIKGGKGDICKLIGLTAQQIKDRTDLGSYKSGWIMPNISNSLTFTGQAQGNTNYTSHWNSIGTQNGGYFPKGQESLNLNFIPAIGYRRENSDFTNANVAASYWLSDISGPNNGYIFYFNSGSINPNSISDSNNRFFLPVRCTPE